MKSRAAFKKAKCIKHFSLLKRFELYSLNRSALLMKLLTVQFSNSLSTLVFQTNEVF